MEANTFLLYRVGKEQEFRQRSERKDERQGHFKTFDYRIKYLFSPIAVGDLRQHIHKYWASNKQHSLKLLSKQNKNTSKSVKYVLKNIWKNIWTCVSNIFSMVAQKNFPLSEYLLSEYKYVFISLLKDVQDILMAKKNKNRLL